MFVPVVSAALAAAIVGAGSAGLPLAQAQDPYSDWLYLYEDAFENERGEEITQRWWLDPEIQRNNATMNFTLLARREPAGRNGTVAGLFDYIADCDSLRYAITEASFLDSEGNVIDSQTYQNAMQEADPDTQIYGLLGDLCSGEYTPN